MQGPGHSPEGDVAVGQIFRAFQMTLGFGPVRMVFTPSRFLVYPTDVQHDFPSNSAYKAWKLALPMAQFCESRNTPLENIWDPYPRWLFDSSQMHTVKVHAGHGIGVDRDCATLETFVKTEGVLVRPSGAMQSLGEGQRLTHIVWRVPGEPHAIAEFLRTMPFGACVTEKATPVVVNWGWVGPGGG